MKNVLILVSAITLTGCGSIAPSTFANRLSCSLDRSIVFVNSMYGPIGVTSKGEPADAAVACAAPVVPAASAVR